MPVHLMSLYLLMELQLILPFAFFALKDHIHARNFGSDIVDRMCAERHDNCKENKHYDFIYSKNVNVQKAIT